MKVNPYLMFNGQCDAAFKTYQRILGGEIVSRMTWSEMPDAEIPPESQKLIMHIALETGENWLMGADALAHDYQQPQGFQVAIHFDDTSEGERIFNALAENGSIVMPFQKTFWAEGFGMCVDQFGIPWMVNCA